MVDYEKIVGKHSVQDYLISSLNEAYYYCYEPLMLRFLRARHEGSYQEKNEDPLVTVYIPTYNRERLLMERSLPSVRAQTYRNIEILIIGDHCTDKTEESISKINDPRIRFFNIPERKYRYPPTAENHWLAGPVVAANKGLELARGKWITRIDDDDVWEPDFIETLLRYAQKNDYEFVSSACTFERYGAKQITPGLHARDPYYSRLKSLPKNPGPLIGSTSTWVFRSYLKYIKYNINCWRKTWNRVNDIEYCLRVFQAGVRMGYVDKVLLHVGPRPGEQAIGLEAYLLKAKEMENHYKFNV